MNRGDKWIRRWQPAPRARLRLFCLPFAGGGTLAFRGWEKQLPADVELCALCPPGRENRIGEPLFSAFAPLVDDAAKALQPWLDRPFAIFGHSMGAMLGFELARRLQTEGKPPAHLLVSGHRAPHLPDRTPPIGQLPDEGFVEELRRYNGTPEAVLESKQLMEMMLPLLRADFTLCETYAYRTGPPLACPISVYSGLSDPDVSREELDAWAQHTTQRCIVRMFPGDHFYLQADASRFLDVVSRELSALQ